MEYSTTRRHPMSNYSLHDIQQRFQDHVLDGGGAMPKLIACKSSADTQTRLDIYVNAYRLRLLEALKTDYPALQALAGDELFERIGHDYIDACPSTHYSIRYFGQHLAAFIADTPGYRESPVLAEMAELEWRLTLAFDAADDPVLDEESLAAMPTSAWPTLRLRFQESLQRCEFHWNVSDVWRAIDQNDAPAAPAELKQPISCVIWRQALQVYLRKMEPAEAFALDCLRDGNDFATACSGLCDYFEPEEVGLKAAGFLKRWCRAGIVKKPG